MQGRIIRLLLFAWALIFLPNVSPAPDLVGAAMRWRYHASATAPPVKWTHPDFNDEAWAVGKAGFGYGDGDDLTVLRQMQGKFTVVHIRTEFEIEDPGAIEKLYLYLSYDDGFIAYLNGSRIASAGITKRGRRVVVAEHEANGYEEFRVSLTQDLLRKGKNVLAIEGHNRMLLSSDFSLNPFLTVRRIRVKGDFPLTRAGASADLAELQRRLEDQSSYLTLRNFDYRGAIEAMRKGLAPEMPVNQFALQVQKILCQLGDCHAGVMMRYGPSMVSYLPVRLGDGRDGIVVVNPMGDTLLDIHHPILTTIDGQPINDWLATAALFVPRGSPQLIRRGAIRELHRIDLLRGEFNLPASDSVELRLASNSGESSVRHTLRLTTKRTSLARVSLGKTRMLAGNIGYLRIPLMRNSQVSAVVAGMRRFKDTNGLIIDVRDNGGGRYGIMAALFGYFRPADAEPHVTNVAAYRLSERFRENHLHSRPTFPADHESWSSREREAIRKLADQFKPEWNLPREKFSDWHYMVIGSQAVEYHYDRPVIVLANAGSFSATDGFLNAMAALPNVRLMGGASGGGSGRTLRVSLPHSQIVFGLSSMASFRPNGKTFDGNGIEVDVTMKPSAEDFLGRSDSVLSAAVKMLKQ